MVLVEGDGVGWLWECDELVQPGCKAQNTQLWPSAAALTDHQVSTEAVDGFAHRFRVSPKHLCPVFLLWIADRCRDNAKEWSILVGPDVKEAIPVVEVVLVSILAGKHNHWRSLRVIRRDCVKFARCLAGGSKHDKRIVACFGHKDAEKGIGLV